MRHQVAYFLNDLRGQLGHTGGEFLALHKAIQTQAAGIGVKVIPTRRVRAVNDALGDFGIDRAPDPVGCGQAGVHLAGAVPVVGHAPLALFLGHIGHGWRVGPGKDHLRPGVKEGSGRFFLDDGVVPGVDPAHVHRTFGAGLSHAQCDGVAQPDLFGDGESGHVAQLGVAIHLGARSGQHPGHVLHVFHGAHQIAKVLPVRLDAGEVDVHDVGELFGHDLHRVHVAKGRAKDQVEAFAGEATKDLLRLGAFGHVFDVGCVDIGHVLLNVYQPFVVGLAPAAIVVGTDEHHGHVELALFDRRNRESSLAGFLGRFFWRGWFLSSRCFRRRRGTSG